jgi:hypothetical protein
MNQERSNIPEMYSNRDRTAIAWRRRTRWAIAIGLFLGLGSSVLPGSIPVAVGQEPEADWRRQINPRIVWPRVYEQLPEFPQGNDYIDRETGEVDDKNTLVGRLISYHVFVKNRLPMFRLDWKLTLADYLGANEAIDPENYPGHLDLEENPLAGDRAILSQLNRQEREQLISVLVNIFNPNYNKLVEANSRSTPSREATSTPTRPSGPPPLPKPGDADLLKL